MLDAMMPFEAGEREHFKLSRINGDFEALRHMLYPSDTFDITYLPMGAKKPLSVKLPAETFEEIQKRIPAKADVNPSAPYSFTIDKKNDVAIMDFRHFKDIEGMRVFADSMFTTLRNDGIGNLIIECQAQWRRQQPCWRYIAQIYIANPVYSDGPFAYSYNTYYAEAAR